MATPLGVRLMADAKAVLEGRAVDITAQETLDAAFKSLPLVFDDLADETTAINEWCLGCVLTYCIIS